MALRDKVTQSVRKAFAAVGDLKIPVTYMRCVLGNYDPATNARAETVTEYALEAVGVGLSRQEVDYFPADRRTFKLLISGADITFIPETTDRVRIEGVRWEVKRVKRVPGDSVYIVYIQEP